MHRILIKRFDQNGGAFLMVVIDLVTTVGVGGDLNNYAHFCLGCQRCNLCPLSEPKKQKEVIGPLAKKW